MDNNFEIKLDEIQQKISFQEIQEYLDDMNVTDIDWNGDELWITDLINGRKKVDKVLSDSFVKSVSIYLSNNMQRTFNQYDPWLEAECGDLRISILHESVAKTGRSVCFRHTPEFKRINRDIMLETNYCSEEICNFMENAVKSHCSIIICGLPKAGKTEYLKTLTEYIPKHERVVTIEDNLEMHYKKINPGKDCVEIKINKEFPYEKAIAVSLRHNAQWTLLSEVRDNTAFHLINNITNGTWCMTTLHTDDVEGIPDRIVNMIGDNSVHDRFINSIYNCIDIGVLIDSKEKENENIERKIDQICVFTRENGENKSSLIYEDGVILEHELPKKLLRKFKKNGIIDPFKKGGI